MSAGIRAIRAVDLADRDGVLIQLEPSGADLDAVLLAADEWWEHYSGYYYDDEQPCWVSSAERVQVGWFRRFPWCNCGEGHSWHFDEASEGARGAFLGVLIA